MKEREKEGAEPSLCDGQELHFVLRRGGDIRMEINGAGFILTLVGDTYSV